MTIKEIIEAHHVSLTLENRLWCDACGLITEEQHFSATKNHELKLDHVAEVLDKHMQERQAQAWSNGFHKGRKTENGSHISTWPKNPYRRQP